MENYWTKKRIELLFGNDTDTLDTFWDQFGPVLYTWMYYQVGADEQLATDLTGEIFEHAVDNIHQFDPARETLFQWLRDQARQVRDQGLEHRQLKPQRPWAWSQLPEDILCGLSLLRSELLPEKVLNNVFVHEIVQAALTELEYSNCQLLMHRYNHLDTAEHIAEEMNCTVEDVQSGLYRCRHSFRRSIFHLIASTNSGFNEANTTGEIETLDTNMEKLLSTTAMYQELSETQTETIKKRLLAAIETHADAVQTEPTKGLSRAVVFTGAFVIVVLIIIIGILLTRNQDTETPPTTPPAADSTESKAQDQTEPVKPIAKQITQDQIDQEELKQVFALGKDGNIDALLEILKAGHFASQVAAAHFLGQLADPSAIELLEQAEQQWYTDPPDNNPFAQAIAAILTRYPDAVPIVTAEETKQEPEPEAEVEKEVPEKMPNVTGIVSDFSNQPIPNVVIELTENTLFSKNRTGRKIASVTTNPNGQYQFTTDYEGPAHLTVKIQEEDTRTVTQSLWCKNDSICIANIGGRPALTGTAAMEGTPLADQKIFLSDTLDLPSASFYQETTTDTGGNFSFLGIPTGVYSLMYQRIDNQIYRLETIDVPGTVTNITANVNIQMARVIVDYPIEADGAAAVEAVLVYAMDIPETLHQAQAVISENGDVIFEDVIPGTYVLKLRTTNNVWIQQEVEIEAFGPQEQLIQIDPIAEETATLTGSFLGASPINLFLTNVNQQIHIDIVPQADGSYELTSIPNDIYSLAAFVKGQLVEFMPIDLQDETEMTLDIDPAEIMQSLSPLYVVVSDEMGNILSGAQVWLTGNEQVITASSTGNGAFIPAAIGNYTLSVAYPDYPTENRDVEIAPSSLSAQPQTGNFFHIQLVK